jgi:hypothetical protein
MESRILVSGIDGLLTWFFLHVAVPLHSVLVDDRSPLGGCQFCIFVKMLSRTVCLNRSKINRRHGSRTRTRTADSDNQLGQSTRTINSDNQLGQSTRTTNSDNQLGRSTRTTNSDNQLGQSTRTINSDNQLGQSTRTTNSDNQLRQSTRTDERGKFVKPNKENTSTLFFSPLQNQHLKMLGKTARRTCCIIN